MSHRMFGVFGAAAAVALSLPALAQRAANVRTEPARIERVEERREVTGEIRTSRRSTLAAQEPGVVLEVLVREGDAVDAGQVVARLDPKLREIEVRRAEAELGAARALVARRESELRDAELDLGRVRQLVERATASQAELDNAEIAVQTARAALAEANSGVAVAEAELADARERLADMAITAPYAGRVVARMTEAGQWVGQGDGVAEIVSTAELEAWVHVPQAIVDRLRDHDAPVTLRVEALGVEIPARIISIVPNADTLSRMFPVRLRIEQPRQEEVAPGSADASPEDPEPVKPGMSAVALVPTGQGGEFLTISKDAVKRDDAGEFVFYDAGGTAMPARIQRIFAFGDRVAIRPGQVREGTPVVVEGNERLYPTQPLMVLNAGEPAQGTDDGSAG